MSIGFTLPFSRSTGSIGYFQATSSEVDAVRQNLRSLILTNWGERVMRFNFGCNLIEFLFTNQRDEELKAKIADRIIDQVAKWMPFLTIDTLNVLFPEDDPGLLDNQIKIFIGFRISSRPDIVEDFTEVVGQGSVR